MNLLRVSETAILFNPKLKQDHYAVNGIINGYYRLVRRQICPRVTKLLRKSVMPIVVLVQCTSDQVPVPWSLVEVIEWQP